MRSLRATSLLAMLLLAAAAPASAGPNWTRTVFSGDEIQSFTFDEESQYDLSFSTIRSR
jgi:hypothetical protein